MGKVRPTRLRDHFEAGGDDRDRSRGQKRKNSSRNRLGRLVSASDPVAVTLASSRARGPGSEIDVSSAMMSRTRSA